MRIDPHEETARLEEFLRRELADPPRHRGYVIGLSGGVDSAVCAALGVRAAGSANVLALLMPERESQPESLELGREVAVVLDIEHEHVDLTGPLEEMGIYERREEIVRRYFPGFGEAWRYRLRLPDDLRRSEVLSTYRLEVVRPDGEVESRRLSARDRMRLQAATNVKQRLRMIHLYEAAEARGFLVLGTTNRTELLQGYFVKHGDGGVDVEPLAHLYKGQVLELARFLGLPDGVIERAPSPDTFSAPVSDEEFYYRLPYEVLDPLLAAFELGEVPAVVAAQMELEVAQVERIFGELQRRERATRRSRALPPAPDWRPAEVAAAQDATP